MPGLVFLFSHGRRGGLVFLFNGFFDDGLFAQHLAHDGGGQQVALYHLQLLEKLGVLVQFLLIGLLHQQFLNHQFIGKRLATLRRVGTAALVLTLLGINLVGGFTDGNAVDHRDRVRQCGWR